MSDQPKERPFGYTVYVNPKDFPGQYVVRGWNIAGGKTTFEETPFYTGATGGGTLVTIRQMMRDDGRTCLNRNAADDPVIVESWI